MAATASRPGAMSLLDKYASINSSIEDARRRVASARSDLERSNERIAALREERNGALVDAEAAELEKARIEANLGKRREDHLRKVSGRERARRERGIAEKEYEAARRRVDDERTAFLERCREFRASCKRMRVAASILVLDGGGNFDAGKDAPSNEVDLWRRLHEEDFSDEEEEEDGEGANDGDAERVSKRKRKKADPEVDLAEKDEKESRQALIEAECSLHAERTKNDDAVKRSDARAQRLTQQRAQLQRHRKEVEEMEREIQQLKDDVVRENQLANAFDKECNKRERIRNANSNTSYGRNFNAPPEESRSGNNPHNPHSNISCSNNFNPPPEESRPGNNPYNSHNSNFYNPYNGHRTSQPAPTPAPSSGYQQWPRGAVANPYNKARQASRALTPPRNAPDSRQRGQSGGANVAPTYASDMLYGATPELGHAQGGGRQPPPQQRHQSVQQHPRRGRHVRNQRQFGTSVGVSLDSGMTDELRESMAAFSNDARKESAEGAVDDDFSDISSSSSDDEDLFSFNVFSKK